MIFLTFILFTSLLMWGCTKEEVEVTPQTEEQASVKERRAAGVNTGIVCDIARPKFDCERGFGLCNCRGGSPSTNSVSGIASINGSYLEIEFNDDSLFTQAAFGYDSTEQTKISKSVANALGYEYIIVQPGTDVTIVVNENCQDGCASLLIVDSAVLEDE